MNYTKEFKDSILKRMLPPNNESITKISREEGLSEQTLRNWRNAARKSGYAVPGTDALSDDWSTQDKFLIVVETSSMSETELAEYVRKKGLARKEKALAEAAALLVLKKKPMRSGGIQRTND